MRCNRGRATVDDPQDGRWRRRLTPLYPASPTNPCKLTRSAHPTSFLLAHWVVTVTVPNISNRQLGEIYVFSMQLFLRKKVITNNPTDGHQSDPIEPRNPKIWLKLILSYRIYYRRWGHEIITSSRLHAQDQWRVLWEIASNFRHRI